jgi:hypothetical protein
MTVEQPTENNNAKNVPCESGACVSVAAEAEAPKPCRKRTFGEAVFDWGAYSLTGVATLIAGVIPGYSARYGKGAEILEPIAENLAKKGMSHGVAKDLIMTSALCIGGFATLPLIKGLENKKEDIVNAINEKTGCSSEKYTQEKGPKITWKSLLKARLAAWTAVFVSFRGIGALIGDEKFAQFEESFAKNVVCKPLNRPTHINGQETKLFRYGRITSLDVFATIAATALLYTGSRFFADKSDVEPVCDKKESAPENVLPANPAAFKEPIRQEASFVDKLNIEKEQPLSVSR